MMWKKTSESSVPFYQKIKQIWTPDSSESIFSIGNQELLTLGSVLQSLQTFDTIPDMNIPKIVVIGTQSSGKSSVLNRMLSLDLLPTGKTIATRTPICLDLQQTEMNSDSTEPQSLIKIGIESNGTWEHCKELSFSTQLSESMIFQIRKHIEFCTEQLAGTQQNISADPISIQVLSPVVPTIRFVDLPGLTMVACTDQGQPKDIKEQLQQLSLSYLSDPNSIIVAVMAARPDLETDMALDLLQQCEGACERTVGVLTKIDLMNHDSTILPYLQNQVSKDLQLGHGYFAVKNRSSQEKRTQTLQDAVQSESTYFSKHPVYQTHIETLHDKLGIVSVRDFCSQTLVDQLRVKVPQLLSIIHSLTEQNQQDILVYGTTPLHTEETRTTKLYEIIVQLTKQYEEALYGRNVLYEAGRKLKELLISYRRSIRTFQMITFDETFTRYLSECLQNSEGNHMACVSSPIELLEHIFQKSSWNPFGEPLRMTEQCVYKVSQLLLELWKELLNPPAISRFQNLTQFLYKTMKQKISGSLFQSTIEDISLFIQIETNYIWTDSEQFHQKLQELLHGEESIVTVDAMKELIESYLETIFHTMSIVIPKKIMWYLVKQSSTIITSQLFELCQMNHLEDLLEEDPGIAQKRKSCQALQTKLIEAKRLLETIQKSS